GCRTIPMANTDITGRLYPPSPQTDTFIADMGRQIDETIRRVVPRCFRTALIDFPNHFNAGDHAIWAGERIALRRAGIRPNYVCSIDTFDRGHLVHAVRDGIILLSGGGNFGDLW